MGTTPTAEVQDSTEPVEDQIQESQEIESQDGSTEAGQATDESGKTPENVTDGTTSTEENSQPDEKDAKIAKLEQELADAKAKIETLETEAIDAQSQIETLTKTAEDARTEATNFKQRCVALATANKEVVVDSIIAKETFDNDDAKAERRKDLMVKSMKELKTINADTQQATVQRTQASVKSPCLAVDDPVSNGDNNNVTDTNTNNKLDNQIKTVDDAAQEVIKRLFK